MDNNVDQLLKKANKLIKKMEEMFLDIFSSFPGGWDYYIIRHKEVLIAHTFWILTIFSYLILISLKKPLVYCICCLGVESLYSIVYGAVVYSCKYATHQAIQT